MNTIYKYPLELRSYQAINIPTGYKILSVQLQGDTICLWAIVDNKAPTELLSISIFGTGEPFNPIAVEFIATVQIGQFVWHIFKNI